MAKDGAGVPAPAKPAAEIFRPKMSALAAVIFILAAIVFYQSGTHGILTRDNGIYLYGGQRLAEGVPPYVSIFDHKGPMAVFIAGAGVGVSRLLGTDDIDTVRFLFLLIGAASGAAVFFLALSLFERLDVALVSSLVFMGFWDFGKQAASGPQAKTPLVLFLALGLLLAVRRRWFAAGLMGTLAAFTWQPAGILPVLVLCLAGFQSAPGERRRAIIAAAAGAAAPAVVIGGYFLVTGSFGQMLEGLFVFNVLRLHRVQAYSLDGQLEIIRESIFEGYPFSAVLIFLGMAAMVAAFVSRLAAGGNRPAALLRDPFAIVFLSFALWAGWSMLDFQGPPDFYPLLIYGAIGSGWLICAGIRGLDPGRNSARLTALALACLALFLTAQLTQLHHLHEKGLLDQKRYVLALKEHFGAGFRPFSIGAPDFLAVAHAANPNPYVFIVSGMAGQIEAVEPGGLAGWFRNLEAYDPNVICMGPTSGPEFNQRVLDWLKLRYRLVKMGKWKIWVKQTDSFQYAEPAEDAKR